MLRPSRKRYQTFYQMLITVRKRDKCKTLTYFDVWRCSAPVVLATSSLSFVACSGHTRSPSMPHVYARPAHSMQSTRSAIGILQKRMRCHGDGHCVVVEQAVAFMKDVHMVFVVSIKMETGSGRRGSGRWRPFPEPLNLDNPSPKRVEWSMTA